MLSQQAGYDLSTYAGQSVSLVKYKLAEEYYRGATREPGEPLYLWVVAKDRTTIGGYITVRESSGFIPGVFAVNDPNIKAPSVMLTQEATGSTVSLHPGQIVTVALQGNGSTGYIWEVVSAAESILVERGDSKFEPDSNATGSDGVYTFTFEATTVGTGSLTLIYHRPWKTNAAPIQTFQVGVVVAN